MQVLKASQITKSYDDSTLILHGINLSIEKGEFVGIMGPSGSGKTTYLSILSGLIKPTSGNIQIDGANLENTNNEDLSLLRRQKFGFVFQQFNLLDSLTLKENIMLPMILDKKPLDEMCKKADTLIKMLGLENVCDKYPYSISGGQQQRVAIGRALINNPTILFADEPTGNLDSKSSQSVMEFFEKRNNNNKDTILMVTHDPITASYCSKIIFIKDGLINKEIVKKDDRKVFFNEILDSIASLGDE